MCTISISFWEMIFHDLKPGLVNLIVGCTFAITESNSDFKGSTI
jgi:hypothetical protein